MSFHDVFIVFAGTPEMAFIHALASATTASFIARACRDGQLASCGCSRSVRPDQLHEDWTWGGCGDDLEFGYKWVIVRLFVMCVFAARSFRESVESVADTLLDLWNVSL